MVSVVCWGAAIAAFGLSTTVWATLLFLAIAGGADMVSGIYRDAVLKTTTPDEMRGRLEGVSLAVVAAGPSLGDLEAGVVASVTSVPFSIVSGGIACIVGVGVLAAKIPSSSATTPPRPASRPGPLRAARGPPTVARLGYRSADSTRRFDRFARIQSEFPPFAGRRRHGVQARHLTNETCVRGSVLGSNVYQRGSVLSPQRVRRTPGAQG